MKKIIGIVLCMIIAVRYSDAMQKAEGNGTEVILLTNDNKQIRMSISRARFFKTIKNMLENTDKNDDGVVPLANVSSHVLQRLVDDLGWVFDLHTNRGTKETDEQLIRRSLKVMPVLAYSQEALKNRIEDLRAADYLEINELAERYARDIAGMLTSDALLMLLQQNKIAAIDLVDSINPVMRRAIYRYMPETWRERFTLADIGPVNSVEYFPDGKKLCTISVNRVVTMWNANNGHRENAIVHRNNAANDVPMLHCSFDGTQLIVANDDVVNIWSPDGRWVKALNAPGALLNSAIFSLDGKKVVSTTINGRAIIWDVKTGRRTRVLSDEESAIVTARFFADKNNERVLTSSGDNELTLWDINTGNILYRLNEHVLGLLKDETSTVVSFKLGYYEEKIVMVLSNGRAVVWDGKNNKIVRIIEPIDNDKIIYAVFFRDGKKLLTVSSNGMVQVWNEADGELLHVLPGYVGRKSIKCSRDGNKVLLLFRNGTIKVWDLIADTVVQISGKNNDSFQVASFSPDGHSIATICNDRVVQVWTELPTHNFEQALYIKLLSKNNQRGIDGVCDRIWGNNILDTYRQSERNLIEAMFPLRSSKSSGRQGLGFSSGSSSNWNNNNSDAD